MTTLDHNATIVLLAIIKGARTLREIAAATGLRHNTTWRRLHQLRDAKLIAFEDNKDGTLRPLVTARKVTT